MPLIIICGTPVSGKTTRATELKQFFENEHKKQVEIISEDEAIVKLGYDKNSTYLDSQKEKRIRGYLKSEVIRLIGKDNVVILDGSNYIKGYRYELYCTSKASKSTQCTVYTIRNQLEAWEENVLRLDVKESNPNEPCDFNNQPYTEEVFNALTKFRFEEPNSNNRWDSPLFTVQPIHQIDLHAIYKVLFEKKPPPPNMSTQNGKGRPLSKIETKCLLRLIESSNIITRKSTDAATNKMKLEEWKKIADAFNAKTIWRRSPQQLRLKWENLKKCSRKRSLRIKMNHQPPLSSTNFLYEMDKTTQAISKQILDSKQLNLDVIKFPEYPDCVLELGFIQSVNPQKLLRLRRQFLTYAKMNHSNEDANKIGRYYIQYLNKTLTDYIFFSL